MLSRDLIIDGDRNNDGLADITLNGRSNGLAFPILTVTGAATHVVIDGVTFIGGGSSAATGASGADGADASGTAQEGASGIPTAQPAFEDDGSGHPGGAGGPAPSAGDGEGFGPAAGAILNEGFLTLRNVAFVGNAAVGGNGGDAGYGSGFVMSVTTVDLGLPGSFDIEVFDPFIAARGGMAAPAARAMKARCKLLGDGRSSGPSDSEQFRF